MLCNNNMNKELQSFSRNIASQLLIGGFALLCLYTIDSKPNLSLFDYTSLYVLGILLILWSMYSAMSNACILYNDYRDYLWSQAEKFDLIHLMRMPNKEDNNLIEISEKFKGLRRSLLLKFRLEGAFILLIWTSFGFIYILGIMMVFLQQTKVLGN